MKRTLFGFTAAALLATGSASAAPLVTETFTYPDGSLVGAAGSTWVNHSGTAGTLGVSGGAAEVSQDSGSEDAHIIFTTVSTDVLVATFDITVTSTGITGTDFEYFAHFMNDGTTAGFSSRLDVVTPTAGGDYTLGIGDGSTGDDALSVDFTFGVPVSVTLAYDFATGIGSVTAGGDTAFADANPVASFDSFALRQSNSSSDETILVDNLVIDVVPEPSSLALLGLGGLLIARRRRG